MKVREESEETGLKLNIQKTKIMASSPITSWQIDGETVEAVTDLIFLDSKITADGDCSHEIKRLLGGGFRMGNTSTPVADSCQCMAKPIQYCKVISLQLNKFIIKKKQL